MYLLQPPQCMTNILSSCFIQGGGGSRAAKEEREEEEEETEGEEEATMDEGEKKFEDDCNVDRPHLAIRSSSAGEGVANWNTLKQARPTTHSG